MRTLIAGFAAAQLGISTRTLGRWAERGKIRAERSACGWRLYDQRDVQRLKRKLKRQIKLNQRSESGGRNETIFRY